MNSYIRCLSAAAVGLMASATQVAGAGLSLQFVGLPQIGRQFMADITAVQTSPRPRSIHITVHTYTDTNGDCIYDDRDRIFAFSSDLILPAGARLVHAIVDANVSTPPPEKFALVAQLGNETISKVLNNPHPGGTSCSSDSVLSQSWRSVFHLPLVLATKIAQTTNVTRGPNPFSANLEIVDARTGAGSVIYHNHENSIASLDWARGGDRLVAALSNNHSSRLVTIAVASGSETPLTEGPDDHDPRFVSNDHIVLFVHSNQLWKIDLGGAPELAVRDIVVKHLVLAYEQQGNLWLVISAPDHDAPDKTALSLVRLGAQFQLEQTLPLVASPSWIALTQSPPATGEIVLVNNGSLCVQGRSPNSPCKPLIDAASDELTALRWSPDGLKIALSRPD